MTTLNNLKKIFVGGLVALSLVAIVACSGAGSGSSDDPTATNVAEVSNTEQVTNATQDTGGTANPSSSDKEALTGSDDLVADDTATAESIPTTFDSDADDGTTGDIGEEVASPSTDVAELTPAEIVAATENHLADVYEEAVRSVVFIYSRTTQGEGSGSGFVWDESGHIVTNYHVIQGATTLTVKFFNGREYRADIVAFDPAADLAVIKIIDLDHELVPIAIGNSSKLRPGQTAIALGNPFGEEFTMTTGIVSAVTRTIDSGFSSYSIPSVIQTDAAINPGNSGGPLLDMSGAVIGVNTQIKSETRQSSGVGFAVPVDLVKRVVPSLIEFGEHAYPLMGISGNEVNLTWRENIGLPGDVVGAYITSVTPDGPADLAGIRGDSGSQFSGFNFDGDVIVAINSIRMRSMDELIGYLALNTAPGEEIVVTVYRNGVEIAIPMTLGARPNIS
jgi:2-alkenal reductase